MNEDELAAIEARITVMRERDDGTYATDEECSIVERDAPALVAEVRRLRELLSDALCIFDYTEAPHWTQRTYEALGQNAPDCVREMPTPEDDA